MRDYLYCEETPLEDDLVVLDLLRADYGDHTKRTLYRPRHQHQRIRVEIEHFYRRDGDLAERDVFMVADATAERLLQQGYVSGTPEWGYTDRTRLQITETGERVLWFKRDELGSFPSAHQWFEYGRWMHLETPRKPYR